MAGDLRRGATVTRAFLSRANGLPSEAMLGLLSGTVGLLRSCVDIQDVIEFTTLAEGADL